MKLIADGYKVNLSMDYDLSENCGNENWTGADILYDMIYNAEIYPDKIYIHSHHIYASRMSDILNTTSMYEKDTEEGGWKRKCQK